MIFRSSPFTRYGFAEKRIEAPAIAGFWVALRLAPSVSFLKGNSGRRGPVVSTISGQDKGFHDVQPVEVRTRNAASLRNNIRIAVLGVSDAGFKAVCQDTFLDGPTNSSSAW